MAFQKVNTVKKVIKGVFSVSNGFTVDLTSVFANSDLNKIKIFPVLTQCTLTSYDLGYEITINRKYPTQPIYEAIFYSNKYSGEYIETDVPNNGSINLNPRCLAFSLLQVVQNKGSGGSGVAWSFNGVQQDSKFGYGRPTNFRSDFVQVGVTTNISGYAWGDYYWYKFHVRQYLYTYTRLLEGFEVTCLFIEED